MEGSTVYEHIINMSDAFQRLIEVKLTKKYASRPSKETKSIFE